MYKPQLANQMDANSRKLRNPDFFDYAQYIEDLELPIDIDARGIVEAMRALSSELNDLDLMSDPEHKYKLGTMVHWMEALLAACELWKVTEEDEYLNAIIIQYNALVNEFNQIVSESALQTDFLQLMRQRPIGEFDDPTDFLLYLHNLEEMTKKFRDPLVTD